MVLPTTSLRCHTSCWRIMESWVRSAHRDPHRLFTNKAGGGLRGDGAAGSFLSRLHRAVFEQGRSQPIFTEEHAQHVPHHFLFVPLCDL